VRQIALTNNPHQSFVFTLNDKEIRIVITWNGVNSFWAFDLYDNNTGELLLGGGAIVSGVNMFIGVPDYNMHGYFLTKEGIIKDPTRNELIYGYLYIGDPDAV